MGLLICRFATAGTIIQQIDVSSTKHPFTIGNEPGVVAATDGAVECTVTAASNVNMPPVGNTNLSNNWISETVNYQVWWVQSTSSDSPPSTLYAHEWLNCAASAQASVIDYGGSSSYGVTSQGYVGPIHSPGALVEISGPGGHSAVQALVGNAKTSVAYSNLAWTVVETLPNGLKVYKNNNLMSVTTPTARAFSSSNLYSGVVGGGGMASAGCGETIIFMVNP